MSDHKKKLEELAYAGQKVKNQLSEDFYNETENFDTLDIKKQHQNKDSQYIELIKNMGVSKKRTSEASNLEQNPLYKGKKVSTADIFSGKFGAASSSSEQEEEESEENNIIEEDEEEYMQEEEMEEEEDELSENLERQLLEEDEDEEGNNENGSDDDEEQARQADNSSSDSSLDQKAQFRKALLSNKKTANSTNKKGNSIDKLMDKIELEDKKAIQSKSKENESEILRSKHTRNQILYWKQQSIDRISLQKPLETVKKFPLEMNSFDNLKSEQKYTELLLLQNLKLLLKNHALFYEKLTKKQETDVEKPPKTTFLEDFLFETSQQESESEYLDSQINISKLQECFEKIQNGGEIINGNNSGNINNNIKEGGEIGTYKFIEDNILKWSQKTNLVSQNLKKQGFSQLLQTPVGQAQKALKQAERLIIKSQLKREKFRILGRAQSNLAEETDVNIYDDTDYYHELLKEQLEEEAAGGTLENVQGGDEDGLHLNSTKIYLLERKLKQQERLAANGGSVKSTVDRRASKARKLRFTTHQKLVNFVNPIENVYLLEGRQEIIRNLFGERVKLYKELKTKGKNASLNGKEYEQYHDEQEQGDDYSEEISNENQKQKHEDSEEDDIEPKVSKKRKLNKKNNHETATTTATEEIEFGDDDNENNFALI